MIQAPEARFRLHFELLRRSTNWVEAVWIRLLLLLTIVPLLELALLLTVADLTGFTALLAFIIGTGFFGAWLLRRQGLKTFHGLREELRGGRLPPTELLNGLLILTAGFLMLTPGVLTDLVGIALLVPQSRSLFRKWLVAYMSSRLQKMQFLGPRSPTNRRVEIIDSYVVGPVEEKSGSDSR